MAVSGLEPASSCLECQAYNRRLLTVMITVTYCANLARMYYNQCAAVLSLCQKEEPLGCQERTGTAGGERALVRRFS